MQQHDYLWIVIVANSFATSVGSRSLTLWQACSIAIFTEFGGAVLLGGETSETIRSGVIDLTRYENIPETLMLSFMCALAGTSFWIIIASKYGAPVSTTHSIVGAIAGVGIAKFGWSSLKWDSFSKILITWVTAPVISGAAASVLFLATKYTVLDHPNSLERGIFAIPFYFMFTLTISFFYIILKAPGGIDLTQPANQTPAKFGLALGLTFGLGVVLVGAVCYGLLVPYFRRLLIEEEDLKWYHALYTPFVPKQPRSANIDGVLALGATRDSTPDPKESDTILDEMDHPASAATLPTLKEKIQQNRVFVYLTRGMFVDVATVENEHVKEIHAKAVKYDNKTEYLYSFLQVCTAAFSSFAHGSNDVSNAAGPFAGIVSIYDNAAVPSNSSVTVWILVLLGLAIDCGLVLYGYRVMKSLGNNITYHSPSRGFSMELGSALTVVTASFVALPVSTTHCSIGATVAVGLCNGELRSINWRTVTWAMLFWVVTVPIVGLISGCLFLLLTAGPRN
ncbi:hypothetical protein HDU91_006055 [Kappamyces sp. JEL0680]|nr:hypothetical protein HDU91_006055 [Kappamyces sp. JEL0680]